MKEMLCGFLADSWFTGAGKAWTGRKGAGMGAAAVGRAGEEEEGQEPETDLSSFFQRISWIQLCRDTTVEPKGQTYLSFCHEDT